MASYTEREAAEKWCPHARNLFAGNTDVKGPLCTCIGSRCMQWRWLDDAHWVGEQTSRRGFCGLAGRP
jgi:hypothetical protein